VTLPLNKWLLLLLLLLLLLRVDPEQRRVGVSHYAAGSCLDNKWTTPE